FCRGKRSRRMIRKRRPAVKFAAMFLAVLLQLEAMATAHAEDVTGCGIGRFHTYTSHANCKEMIAAAEDLQAHYAQPRMRRIENCARRLATRASEARPGDYLNLCTFVLNALSDR